MNLTPELEQLADEWPICRDFDLKPDDLVVVAGAYTGRVMDLLLRLYPGIHVAGYEPAKWARVVGRARLEEAGHPENAWYIHPFGIGTRTAKNLPMGEWGTDACSFVNHGEGSREQGVGDIEDWRGLRYINEPGGVALYVINMEGYEFELLWDMVQAMSQPLADSALIIQWHLWPRAQGAYFLMPVLATKLASTHDLIWNEWPQWTYYFPKARP